MQKTIKLTCSSCEKEIERSLRQYNSYKKRNSDYLPFCSSGCYRSRKINSIPKEEVMNLYNSGKSSVEIGRLYALNGSTILVYLRKWGVTLRTQSENCILNNPMQGKTHSPETREKLREINKKQFSTKEARELASHNQIEYMKNNPNRQQRSKLEFIVEKELDGLGIKYKSPYPIQDPKTGKFRALADIYLIDHNTVIEVNGTYWHSDPRFYPDGPVTHSQKHVESKYSNKIAFYKEKNLKLIELWEYDIKRDVSSEIELVLRKTGIIK